MTKPNVIETWLVDNAQIRLDAALQETVQKMVGKANHRFRTSIFRDQEIVCPYFFEVRHAPPSTGVDVSANSFVRASPSLTLVPKKKVDQALLDFVFAAIRDRAILRATPNKRILSPDGTNFAWMIDMRRIFMDATTLDAVAEIFWDRFADNLPFQVGGMEVAAIPLLTAILAKSVERGTPINGIIFRKERKVYGEGKLYEGILNEHPIIIVDDLINSGRSIEKVRVILEQEYRKIDQIFTVVDYEGSRGMRWRAKHNLVVTAPFKLSAFNLNANKGAKKEPEPLFTEVWNFAPPDPNFYHRVPKSFPATDGKRVYFGSDCGYFWCLDAVTGKEIWKKRAVSPGHKNIWSSPSLHNGRVFFGSYDGSVYCLDTETGKEIWRWSECDWVGSSPALAPDIGLLFVGLEFSIEGQRGGIVALNIDTGEPVWQHKHKRYTHASPAYWPERKLVACGSNDNEMFLYDAETGHMRWRFETHGEAEKGSIRHAPAFDTKRNHVVTGCADGYIYIIDVDTGLEVWRVKTDNTVYTVPLVVGDYAYVGSTDKHMYILDLENRVVKRRIFGRSKILAPPRLINGVIYYGGCNGVINALDPETHEIIGMHQLPDAITNAMTYSAETGLYYAQTYMNQLFALKPLTA